MSTDSDSIIHLLNYSINDSDSIIHAFKGSITTIVPSLGQASVVADMQELGL